ncbi:MAG: DUF6599 family protein [Phycisphaerae bacterium]|jgi:hypothetical protein
MPEAINKNRTHTIISYIILFVLIIIFIGIITKQKHYYVPAAPTTANTASENKSVTPKTQDWLNQQLFGADFKPANEVESYNADNLYEKIDGKADLYLQNEFVSLQCRRYSSKQSDQEWAEVYVYDMAKGKNAFAVYSGQKRRKSQPLGWAQFGYKTKDAVYSASGNFYFEIILSSDANQLLDSAESAAKQLTGFALKEPSEPFAINFFPKDNFVFDSLKLIKEDAFGCAEMKNIFTAAYSISGNDMTVFIADMPDSSSAQVLFDKYYNFLIENGGTEPANNIDIPGSKAVELFGTTDIIFRYENYFAGVRGSGPIGNLTNLAVLFKNSLAGTKNGTK